MNSRNPWNFRNQKETTREAIPKPRQYVKKGHKKRQGKRFRFLGYDLARLEDLPKSCQQAADALAVGESILYPFRNLKNRKQTIKKIERTF